MHLFEITVHFFHASRDSSPVCNSLEATFVEHGGTFNWAEMVVFHPSFPYMHVCVWEKGKKEEKGVDVSLSGQNSAGSCLFQLCVICKMKAML